MLNLTDYKDAKSKRGQDAGGFGISDGAGVEKAIPHNPEAEEAVIGSLLIDRDIILKVSGILEPSDFFSLERSSIYQAILDLYANRAPADLITLRNELRERGLLGEEEGQVKSSYLINLMRSTPTPVHVRHYAEIVRKYSALRKLITFGARATTAGFGVQEEPGTAFAEVATQLQELLNWWKRGQEQDYFMRHEASLDLFDKFSEEENPAGNDNLNPKGIRLRFGFNCLDGQDPDIWGGGGEPPSMLLLRSTLTAIVADTSVGKTILAEQIAEANAKAGANVLFFHNELSHEQMYWRRNTRMTGIPVWKQVDRRQLSSKDLRELAEANAEVADWKGRVDLVFCADWTAKEIAEEARARHLALEAGKGHGYDLIICDYLQNMGVEDGRDMRSEKMARNVHVLHNLSGELDVAVLFTSQVSRDGNKGEGFIKPTLHGGLDTGSIERHSNQVLGLWREAKAAEVICLKSTFGKRGWTKQLEFVEDNLEFVE